MPEALTIFLFAIPSAEVIWRLSIILLLLFITALFAAAKVAVRLLTTSDLKKIQATNAKLGGYIAFLRKQPQRLNVTLALLNNIVLLCGLFIFYSFVIQAFNTLRYPFVLVSMPPSHQNGVVWANAVGISMTATVIALLIMAFGEATPKAFVQQNRVILSKWMAAPLWLLMKAAYPVSSSLLAANRFIDFRLSKFPRNQKNSGKEGIEEATEMAINKNEKEPSESEMDMLKSIVKFSDVTVRQIMASRVDVVAVDEEISYAELLEIVTESGYSRIPVYKGDFDNIRGILYVKDLLKHLNTSNAVHWQSLVRPNVLYVPESKKISDVLREFQRQRLHMAIVVDEYGGSSGIVTLEDVLEEIIGDIKDEFDDEAEVLYKQIDDHTYIFEGKTMLQEVYQITGIEPGTFDAVRAEAESLGGLMLALHGQIPRKDTELRHENFRFKIIAVNKRRIEQVQVVLPTSNA